MGHKLLVADDSVTIQRVIELTFADEDVQVVAVGDGQQAIDRIGRERPDIVLADVSMPERDGYEVARFIKGTPQLAHIPVILLTGAFEPVDEAQSEAAGCDGVLTKPFEPQVVINRVRELLARRPAPRMEAVAVGVDGGTPPPGADSLEDYFDRLDAAFANLGSRPPLKTERLDSALRSSAAPPEPDEVELRVLDAPAPVTSHVPEVEAAAAYDSRPVEPEPVFGEPYELELATHPLDAEPMLGDEAPVQTAGPGGPAGAAEPPALAEAFSALLAAERGLAAVPEAAPRDSTRDAASDEALLEQVTARVLERLSERLTREVVSEVVLNVADRLVRQEIERIRADAE